MANDETAPTVPPPPASEDRLARQQPTTPPKPPQWRTEGHAQPDGAPAGGKPPHPMFNWRWVAFFAGLLLINFWVASNYNKPAPHTRIPYSPLFLAQVRAGNVGEVTSKGTAIQGTFKRPVLHEKNKISSFQTEIPAFANTDQLAALLQAKGVVINAKPLATGAPWWQSLLFGFAPTLLFIGLLFWLMRRAAAGAGGGGLMSFGRSRAKRYEPSEQRVTFADVAGIDEA